MLNGPHLGWIKLKIWCLDFQVESLKEWPSGIFGKTDNRSVANNLNCCLFGIQSVLNEYPQYGRYMVRLTVEIDRWSDRFRTWSAISLSQLGTTQKRFGLPIKVTPHWQALTCQIIAHICVHKSASHIQTDQFCHQNHIKTQLAFALSFHCQCVGSKTWASLCSQTICDDHQIIGNYQKKRIWKHLNVLSGF